MKKIFYILLFLSLNLFLGYQHYVYLDEFSSFVLVDDLVNLDFASFIRDYPQFVQTPLTMFISAFFRALIKNILGYRLLLFFSSCLLFFFSYKILKKLNQKEEDSLFASFFISSSFPILYTFHFLYAEPLSVLFLVISIYFYLNKDILSFVSNGIFSFLSKQLGIAALSPLLLLLHQKKLKKIDILKYSSIILFPLIFWIFFVYSNYGSFLSPGGHEFILEPLLLLGKTGWLIGILGFYSSPFFFNLIENFKKYKSKLKFLFFALLLFFPFSIKFFGSRSFITESENYKIHGSIPLFYHILPDYIYTLFILAVFQIGILYIFFLFSTKKNYYPILLFSFFALILLLGGKNQPTAELRHTIYFVPIIIFSLLSEFKLNKLSKFICILFIIYSFFWAYFLINLANTSGEIKEYLLSNNITCFYSNLPIYKLESSCVLENSETLITAPGFSENISFDKFSEIKSFDVLKIYKIKIYEKKAV